MDKTAGQKAMELYPTSHDASLNNGLAHSRRASFMRGVEYASQSSSDVKKELEDAKLELDQRNELLNDLVDDIITSLDSDNDFSDFSYRLKCMKDKINSFFSKQVKA